MHSEWKLVEILNDTTLGKAPGARSYVAALESGPCVEQQAAHTVAILGYS